jgi:hypothetical protein
MINLIDFESKIRQEELRHKNKINDLRLELKSYQKICKHDKGVRFHEDPSGNNDSWSECRECGAEI